MDKVELLTNQAEVFRSEALRQVELAQSAILKDHPATAKHHIALAEVSRNAWDRTLVALESNANG